MQSQVDVQSALRIHNPALIQDIFQKPQVWKESLDYSYLNTHKLFPINGWHISKRLVVDQMTRFLRANLGKPFTNVCVASINIIYKNSQNQVFVSPAKDIHKFFISGRPTDSEIMTANSKIGTVLQQIHTSIKVKYASISDAEIQAYLSPFLDYAIYSFGQSGKNFGAFQHHLQTSTELVGPETTQLSAEILGTLLAEIQRPLTSNTLEFLKSFAHSEQALLTYLQSSEGLAFIEHNILNTLPPGTEVLQIALNIVSFFDICERCATTLFRESEAGKAFISNFFTLLGSKGFKYSPIGTKLFVDISSLFPYIHSRNAKETALYSPPIVSKEFTPYIAQAINEELRAP